MIFFHYYSFKASADDKNKESLSFNVWNHTFHAICWGLYLLHFYLDLLEKSIFIFQRAKKKKITIKKEKKNPRLHLLISYFKIMWLGFIVSTTILVFVSLLQRWIWLLKDAFERSRIAIGITNFKREENWESKKQERIGWEEIK